MPVLWRDPQLFLDRAAASTGSFSLDELSAPAVVEICRRLDGIPLAIELAAARVEFFGVSALASRLDDMFAVLTQGRRFALPRHQTLRATLDWGYNLLSPIEQTVLRCISIFRATFTLDSALAVAVGPAASIEKVVDAMANLVAKSLLNAESMGDAVLYRLLEATRLYAAEKLAASDEGPPTARRHAEHLLALIETAPSEWWSDLGKQWLQVHAGRIDDVRAALDWSFSQGGDLSIGLRLTANSLRLWLQLSLTLEYVERIERTLQRLSELPGPDLITEMRLQIAFGHAIWYSGSRRNRLEGAFARALELADQVGTVPSRLQALCGAWAVRRARGQYREALTVAESYEAVAKTAGDAAAVVLSDRYSHDQRVVQADLKISPKPRSLRFVQDAFGNHVGIARFSRRSNELSFESIVRLQNSPREIVLDPEDAGRAFPVGYRVTELRDLAPYVERQQHDPTDEVGRWARRFLLPSGPIGAFKLLTQLSQGIHHGFVYRRREAKGIQLPVETLRLGHGSCRDFAALMIEAARSIGFAARFASG